MSRSLSRSVGLPLALLLGALLLLLNAYVPYRQARELAQAQGAVQRAEGTIAQANRMRDGVDGIGIDGYELTQVEELVGQLDESSRHELAPLISERDRRERGLRTSLLLLALFDLAALAAVGWLAIRLARARTNAQAAIVSANAEFSAGVRDIERLREQLKRQSFMDTLTELYSRSFFEESLRRELLRAERHSTPLSLILLDIDRLKHWNDAHGRDAGDRVLHAVGVVLKRLFRGSDVACRYDGGHIAVLLPEAGAEATMACAERLRETIHRVEVPHTGITPEHVTISIGIATYPQHGTTGESLLQAAEQALRRAKRDGRDRVAAAG
jgi:diguanylate cyclase (GGDEF)-like protein